MLREERQKQKFQSEVEQYEVGGLVYWALVGGILVSKSAGLS